MTEPTSTESPNGEKYQFQKVRSMKLDVHQFKPGSIYKTKAEMDKAVKTKKFDLNKTMAIKNGRLFFLCYE